MTRQADPDIVRRLKRAEGHLHQIIAMIEGDRPCPDLAQQLQAVENAIDNAKQALIYDQIARCLDRSMKRPGSKRKAALAEFTRSDMEHTACGHLMPASKLTSQCGSWRPRRRDALWRPSQSFCSRPDLFSSGPMRLRTLSNSRQQQATCERAPYPEPARNKFDAAHIGMYSSEVRTNARP